MSRPARLALLVLLCAAPVLPAAAAVDCANAQPQAAQEQWAVRFATGSAALDDTARRQIGRAADRIRGRFASEVCLIGQASRVGSAAANVQLSRQRIAAVQAELRRRGVEARVLGSRADGAQGSGALVGSNESGERAVQVLIIR
jgi:outer membrane protein OmpA-like peptidoglycan-associated protein